MDRSIHNGDMSKIEVVNSVEISSDQYYYLRYKSKDSLEDGNLEVRIYDDDVVASDIDIFSLLERICAKPPVFLNGVRIYFIPKGLIDGMTEIRRDSVRDTKLDYIWGELESLYNKEVVDRRFSLEEAFAWFKDVWSEYLKGE